MIRPVYLAAILTALPGIANAGGITLCNGSSTTIRSAAIIKEGFDYLSDTWANNGWYYVQPGACQLLTWSRSGSRAWGFVSVEHKYTEQELARYRSFLEKRFNERQSARKATALLDIQKKKAEAMASFTFYDTLVYYLPGSDQQAALAAFDEEYRKLLQAPIEKISPGDLDAWRPKILEERSKEIDEPGFTGTDFTTCLPTRSFKYNTAGRPSARTKCSSDERSVQFTMEVWVKPGATLTLTVKDSSVNSNYRG